MPTRLACPCRFSHSTRVSHAFGHLPLLDDMSLQIDAGERCRSSAATAPGSRRCCRSSAVNCSRTPATVWRQPALRVARLVQDVPLTADAIGVRTWSPTGFAAAVAHDAEEWRARAQGRSRPVASRACRPTRASIRCPAAGGGACCWRARSSPSRTCCCSTSRPTISTSTPSRGSRTSWPSIRGALVFVTHDRAFLQRLATRIVELDRGTLTSWPGDYATFLQKKEEWLANEALTAGEVRQEARAGGSLAAAGRQGAADARRGARQGADGDARGARGTARRRSARRRIQVERADASGKLVFEAEHVSKVLRRPRGRARLHDAHHARRPRRAHRAERRRQDDAAAAAARRPAAGRRRGPPRRERAGRLLRSAARAARPGAHGLRHRRRRQRHRHRQRAQPRTCTATCATSCSPTSARGRR